MGTFVAKSILDDRLIELPISQQMWDLIFDKPKSLFDLSGLDSGLYSLLCDLQLMANRKREIDDMCCDQEQKDRLLETVKSKVSPSFDFTLSIEPSEY